MHYYSFANEMNTITCLLYAEYTIKTFLFRSFIGFGIKQVLIFVYSIPNKASTDMRLFISE